MEETSERLQRMLSELSIFPSKSEISEISKYILDTINKFLLLKAKVNQWKNTLDAIT